MTSLLSVRELGVRFHTEGGAVRAAEDVSFDVGRGETVCLVGESGSGKTAVCEAITGLVDRPPAAVSGSARLDGEELIGMDERALRAVRGRRVGQVFQNPRGALDPVYSVGAQVVEAIRAHRTVDRDDARGRAVDLLRRVGVSRPADRFDQYPHEFSAGMCQRAAVAIALAGDPDLLVADEPTSALDVTVQARILELLDDLSASADLGLLLVTHDLRVVAALADRVVVMYDGDVVERGPVAAVFDRPAHPYTRALFRSFGEGADATRADRTRTGRSRSSTGRAVAKEVRPSRHPATPETASSETTSSASAFDRGCRFREECPHAVDACATDPVDDHPVAGDDAHEVACVHYADGGDPRAALGERGSVLDEVTEDD